MSDASIQEYQNRLRDALAFIGQLKSKLEGAQRAKTEPIAIIGMGCRFPGGGVNPDVFFRALENGVDGIRSVPEERWPADALPDDHPEIRWVGLIDSIDDFDAAFFEISPREALSLDPQQRLLLEIVWEALEDAGQRPDRLKGSPTGVFVGLTTLDYQQRCFSQPPELLDGYAVTGNMASTAAGRISFTLGLQGPCMAIDTACSSSLVAIHLACQSLRNHETDLAISGGVNIILAPLPSYLMARLHALAPDGRCKTFDARANGYVRGEGCGIIVLKRLSDAVRDGDRILAVLRGSGINQDGRSTGLTTPNVLAQESLLRQVLAAAKLSAQDIGYVETHGTGTPLGDPIEIDAIRSVFGDPRPDGTLCILGAVKTNLGHLEAAAGVAGVIKAVQALRHDLIPKNLHFQARNPRIDIEGTPLTIPTTNTLWPRGTKPRRVGVSGFGISGTNAHVILEEAPAEKTAAPAKGASAYLLPLSAKTPQGLSALAEAYAQWFSGEKDVPLQDVTYTASARRMHHEHRLAAVARTREEFANILASFAQGQTSAAVTRGRANAQTPPKVVFIFPGQGSQWIGMGRQLVAEEPIFRAAIEMCEPAIRNEAGFSLLEQIAANEAHSRLAEIDVVQPLLFAIQVALAALWRSWGIEPDCVVGHSMGEVAAAHVAGMLSLEDASKVICRRSRLLKRISGQGAMGLVELPLAATEAAIASYTNRLGIAVSNGPQSTVVSGDPGALEELLASLEMQGVFCRRVKVDVASHSPQVDSLRDDLLDALRDVRPTSGKLPMRSTVTEGALQGSELIAAYWADNLREPVRFSQVTQKLMREAHDVFVEISPHPILVPSIEENLAEVHVKGAALASIRRQSEERRTMLETLGSLYILGCTVDWAKMSPEHGHIVSLPNYPWQRERFWIDPPRQTNHHGGKGAHPLLGIRFDSSIAPGEHVWQQTLSVEALPYLADHRVLGDVVFPGAGYVEMAIAAASAVYGSGVVVIEEMSLDQLLSLLPNAEREVQLVLQKDDDGFAGIAISSRGADEASWVRHVTVRVRVESTTPAPSEALRAIEDRCGGMVNSEAHYARMDAQGLLYGNAFRGVQYVRIGDGEVLGRISLPATAAPRVSEYSIHPGLLDACLQAASWALASKFGDTALVPREFINLRYYARPTQNVWGHGRVRESTDNAKPSVEIVIYDDMGRVLVEIEELRLAPLDRINQKATEPYDGWLFDVAWRKKNLPAKAPEIAQTGGAWLVLADAQGIGRAVAARLREHGETCVEAFAGLTFHRGANGEYQLDATDPSHLRRLLGEAFSPERPCKGVLHLLNLDATSWELTTPETLSTDLRQGCVSTVRLTQALMVQGWRDLPRLYLVTCGVHSIENDPSSIAIAQAPIWGLGRTIALEHPALECTRLDLSPVPPPSEVESIVLELLSGDSEDQIAIRSSGRFVARLARSTIAAAPQRDFVFRSDHTYLITGGLGGLGLSLAGWMVAQGARHLVLVGRTAPTSRAIDAIKVMEQAGANVRAAQADVSQREDLAKVLLLQRGELPPLAGIVHAAAVLDDRTLLELSEETFLRVMGAKVFGALNLHALTSHQNLDFFVLYSSAAGLLGSPGQGNYAAANAFIDAFARARTAAGMPAMSIAWGPFTDVGLAAAQENRGKRLADRGIEGISPETGHVILEKLLNRPRAEVAVMRLSVRQWREFFPQAANLPMFAELAVEEPAGDAGHNSALSFRQLLESTESNMRAQVLRAHVLEHLGRVLRLDPTRIEPVATFASLGVDSLMTLELRNRLQASLGLDLRATLLFTYPTTDKLVTFILDNLDLRESTTPTSAVYTESEQEKEAAQAEPIAEMAFDDLMAMLDEELSATKKGG